MGLGYVTTKKIQRVHVLKHLLKKSISISYFVHKEVCILPVINFSIFIVTLKLKSDNNSFFSLFINTIFTWSTFKEPRNQSTLKKKNCFIQGHKITKKKYSDISLTS